MLTGTVIRKIFYFYLIVLILSPHLTINSLNYKSESKVVSALEVFYFTTPQWFMNEVSSSHGVRNYTGSEII